MKHEVSCNYGRLPVRALTALSAVAGLLFLNSLASAQAPMPQLTSVFPPGGKAGAPVDVATTGVDLDEADKLVFSHPGITATVKAVSPSEFVQAPAPQYGQFTVQIAADVPTGIYEARAIGRFGVSNARPFVVGSLNEVVESGNNTVDKALEVPVGTVVNGRADANNYDYFKLTLKQGQQVLIDCCAQRIDSRMDPTVAVTNAAGNELARMRDVVGDDPVLLFTAPADGTYLVKLNDAVFAGGGEHFYRLTIAAAPFVEFVFPPSAVPGASGQFTLYGFNLPGGQPTEGLALHGVPLQKLNVTIPAPADEAAQTQLALGLLGRPQRAWQDCFEFRLPTPQGPANPVNVYFARATVTLEQEPNNEAAQVQKITLPCEVAGQFFPQADMDTFQFEAKKGEVYWIHVFSHQLGLAADPFLTVSRVTKNDKGEEVVSDIASVDDPAERQAKIGTDFDTSSDDPSYKLTVPADGTYRVSVRDQFGSARKDPSIVYRLSITPPQPDFRLLATNGQPPNAPNQPVPLAPLLLKKGGTELIQVNIDRRHEFTGDVQITAEGLPPGVTAQPAIMGGNVETASLVLTAAENATGGAYPIRIVGRATIDGKEIVRQARYCRIVWGTANRTQVLPEFRLSQELQVGIVEKDVAPALVQSEDKLWETAVGGKIEVPVTVTRRGEFKEPIKLVGAGLPNEIKPKELTLDGNTAQGKVEIALAQQNIKPGIYTFYLRGETKQKVARNPDAVAQVEAEQKQLATVLAQLAENVKTATTARDQANQKVQETQNTLTTATQNKTAATTEQKQKADALKQATDKLTAAQTAEAADAANQALKDASAAAQKAVDEATAQLKQADEKLAAADKALADSTAAKLAADAAKTKAEADLKTATDKVTRGNQAMQQLDKRATQVKQANQPKDVNLVLVSTPIKLKIASTPVSAAVSAPATVKQGEKGPLAVTVTRLYGFDQPVEVLFELPPGVKGISAAKVDLPNGQIEAKLEVTAAADATPGEHTCTIKLRTRWNNVQAETTVPAKVKIDPKT